MQSDLEEGFTIENVSQLISKKTKTALPFFQVTLPHNDNNQKVFDLKTIGYMQVKIEGYRIREELPNVLTATISFTRQKTATSSQDV
ncbi:hypothetical protein TNCV_439261 [Trichonephila clavipes]|nr:hypothetical protein TNCV_439261 [Trichonephila clavipes]